MCPRPHVMQFTTGQSHACIRTCRCCTPLHAVARRHMHAPSPYKELKADPRAMSGFWRPGSSHMCASAVPLRASIARRRERCRGNQQCKGRCGSRPRRRPPRSRRSAQRLVCVRPASKVAVSRGLNEGGGRHSWTQLRHVIERPRPVTERTGGGRQRVGGAIYERAELACKEAVEDGTHVGGGHPP